ncbi:MAG: MgtC/SapB family protein [Candidatus Methanoperedens sp.]|nr:MgtC/SapB family protein [Candidatus Methanoperedens sp.]
MEISVILLRLIITFVLSLIFGIERQRSHKPIGFGAFIFVSVGACGLAITATVIDIENSLPLLGAIVTGIGFLGAGALIKTNDKTFGFTTAASIWVFAIFGIATGVGQYFIGISIYILTWIVILCDKLYEKKGIGHYQKKLIINTNRIIDEIEIKNQLLSAGSKRTKFISIDVDKKNDKITITYLIEGTAEEIYKIPKTLFEKDWLESCKIE